MRKAIAVFLALLFLAVTAGAYFAPRAWAADPLHQRPIISVLGRLALEKHGKEEWLVLHAKNAETYYIKGELVNELRDLLSDLGPENLVFLTGNQDGSSRITCERKYDYDRTGGIKDVSVRCIRYYNLDVTHILDAKQSSEYMPPPRRDTAEEKRLIARSRQEPMPPVLGELGGKIAAVYLKSPIKTVEIENLDEDSPLKKIIVIISQFTRIVKKIGDEEPRRAILTALKPGQEVWLTYYQGELYNVAESITITKE